jgi:hypothetical protein
MFNVAKNDYSGELFMDHFDALEGLALTLEERKEDYENAVGSLDGSVSEPEEEVFDEVTRILEHVFDETMALDALIEYAEMKTVASSENGEGVVDLSRVLRENCERYDGIDSLEGAVFFACILEEQERELRTEPENGGIAGKLIDNYGRILDVYESIDEQFEWIIENETKARENITQNGIESYKIETPLYRLLNTEYEPKAAKLNAEV